MPLVARLEKYMDKNGIFDLTQLLETTFSDDGKPQIEMQ